MDDDPGYAEPHTQRATTPSDQSSALFVADMAVPLLPSSLLRPRSATNQKEKSSRLHVSGLILRRGSRALVGVGLTKVCGGAEPPRRNNNSHGKSRQPIVAALLREADGALGRTAPRRTTPEPAFPSCPPRRSSFKPDGGPVRWSGVARAGTAVAWERIRFIPFLMRADDPVG